MSPTPLDPVLSRRQFVRRLARGAAGLGAVTYARAAGGAEKNPFAYDVERYARTDPKLVGWEETGRRTCAVKEARRLALGPDDAVFIAAGSQVVRWTAGGERPALELGAPVRCVAVTPDGELIAGLTDRLVRFDAAGRRQAEWPAPGPKTWFTGLAVTPQGVFAADSGHRVIWRLDPAGKVLGRIGARDTTRGVPGLVLPSPFLDVRLHPDGLLRVNDPGRHRIEAYTVDGDFEAAWGEPTAAIHGFCGCCNPIGLAVLPDGRIVTGEKGLTRVKVHRVDGTFESVVAGPETFAENTRQATAGGAGVRGGLDVAADARGWLHVLDRVTGEVRTLQPRSRA